jgi:putative addiction module component (TIGR02574 family)
MTTPLENLEQEALRLSQQDRAFLADRLLSSLDDVVLNDVDAAWIAEAERRYKEHMQGKRQGIPAQDVLAEAHSRLK